MTRALVTKLLNALEYHQSQTRPIHNTELDITAAREYLATEPSGERAELIQWLREQGACDGMLQLSEAADMLEADADLRTQLARRTVERDMVISMLSDTLEADAQRITELDALSVTKIMIDVVPGDGAGLEVFAKSTSDVEDLLTKMDEKIEDFESSKWAQQAKRVPMTDSEIYSISRLHPRFCTLVPHLEVRDFARAIEAHHGITPADKPIDGSAA